MNLRLATAALLAAGFTAPANPPDHTIAQQTTAMAERIMRIWPAGVVQQVGHPGSWGYEEGTTLDGIAAHWRVTHDPKEFAYLKAAVDRYLTPDGTIEMDGVDAKPRPYPTAEHTLDDIELGRTILLLYRETHEAKYANAAKFLRQQLRDQPRTPSGAFWHKQIYPNQVWLDGAYMAGPFLTEYGVLFHEPEDFDEVTQELLLIDAHMRDPKTGLLRHGWDESKKMPWADPATGLSPEAWARADGWYAMALVDILELLPATNPNRPKLVLVAGKTMSFVDHFMDKKTGLWWQVMDKPDAEGNYPEASATCMFTYALAKGVRLHYLPQADQNIALKAWQGIQNTFITSSPNGPVLTGTVRVGGLGGKPYRAGDYAYYVHETKQDDDPKGIGAYLKAGSELTRINHN